jgi:preprotein translocase subunit YajC
VDYADCYVCYHVFLHDSSSEQETQKEIANFRKSLEVNQRVVTAGGIYGKIKEVGDDYVILEIADNVKVRIDKNSVFAAAADTEKK